jgi:steroid delta-isomerase-like uncharacterized protein
MKNVMILMVLAVMLGTVTGCNKECDACVKSGEENKQLADNLKMYETTWDEIINKRKIDMINDKNFTSDITMIAKPENVVGIDAFKKHYDNFLTGFSEISFTVTDIFGKDDKIVKHWNFKGKHTGDFFGIAPTGKDVNISGVTLVKMKDGKIAQEHDFYDNMEFMQQLGVIPAE